MTEYVPMTRDGYNRIRAEIDKMENVDMPAITEKLAEARAEGDLKENAEYHAQRENQGMLQAKIGALKGKLANAHIVDPSQMPKGEVAFGATVTVKDLDDGEEEAYTLVGAGDEDYDVGKILLTSPIGVALVQKKVGEKVEIAVPSGVLKYEVMKIEYKGM